MSEIMQALTINTEKGLLDPVIFCPSPNCNDRPEGITIDLVIVHGISLPPGIFGTTAVEDFFCNKLEIASHPFYYSIAGLKVAAHLLIKRTGKLIQFVPFHLRAWHAGESYFCGQTGCNDFSIGIELEGTDDVPYEFIQYHQLGRIIKLLMHNYPNITLDRIVGHNDVAPGRKTDPGPFFDWAYLKGLIK